MDAQLHIWTSPVPEGRGVGPWALAPVFCSLRQGGLSHLVSRLSGCRTKILECSVQRIFLFILDFLLLLFYGAFFNFFMIV